jgi:uncharacterized protein YyaL (SSP411 family)
MLSKVQDNIIESAAYFANWAKLQLLFVNNLVEVAVVGDECLDFNKTLNKYFLPNAIITGCRFNSNLPLLKYKLIENQTSVYICKNKVCSLPITDVAEALEKLEQVPHNHKTFSN